MRTAARRSRLLVYLHDRRRRWMSDRALRQRERGCQAERGDDEQAHREDRLRVLMDLSATIPYQRMSGKRSARPQHRERGADQEQDAGQRHEALKPARQIDHRTIGFALRLRSLAHTASRFLLAITLPQAG
jgi:hypothetical protein